MSVRLVDTAALAVLLGLSPATIRWHAHRGHLTRAGRDRRGRTLYDLDHALLATRLAPGLTPPVAITNTHGQ